MLSLSGLVQAKGGTCPEPNELDKVDMAAVKWTL